MGRGKIEMKLIENPATRNITFTKRRAGLFKKAKELSILCDAEVAVIIFSSTGKIFEYASSSMKKILTRYMKCLELKKNRKGVPKQPETPQTNETDALKAEIERLKSKQMRLLGKDTTAISLQDLDATEEQLNQALISVKERKEQVLLQELNESKLQEQHAMLENQALREQIHGFQSFLVHTNLQTQLCIGFASSSTPPIEKGSHSLEMAHTFYPSNPCTGHLPSSTHAVNEDSHSLDNSELPSDYPNTILHLGLPSGYQSPQNAKSQADTSWDSVQR